MDKVREIVGLGPRKCNVALIGLDGSGKTSILNNLTGRSERKVIPTVGISKPRTLQRSRYHVKLYDLGGTAGFRPSWTERLARCHAAIFVVDASDKRRIVEIRDEFNNYVSTEAFAGKPVIILTNKEDSRVFHNQELVEILSLKGNYHHGTWRVMSCVGAKQFNQDEIDLRLMDAIRWLEDQIDYSWKTLNKQVLVKTKFLEKRDKKIHKANKKSVAEKRKAKKKLAAKKKSSVVPEDGSNIQENAQKQKQKEKQAKASVKVMCKNKILSGDARIDCRNEATKRTATSSWQPFCDECHAAAEQQANQEKQEKELDMKGVSKLEAVVTKEERLCAGKGSPHQQLQNQASAASSSPLTSLPSPDDQPLSAKRKLKKHKKKKSKKSKRKDMENKFVKVKFELNQKVEVNYHGKGTWYSGKVAHLNTNGTLAIHYDDGDKEDEVNPFNAIPFAGPLLPAGTKVEVRYKGKSRFFPGTIESSSIEDKELYVVNFEDGDRDERVPRNWILVRKY